MHTLPVLVLSYNHEEIRIIAKYGMMQYQRSNRGQREFIIDILDGLTSRNGDVFRLLAVPTRLHFIFELLNTIASLASSCMT